MSVHGTADTTASREATGGRPPRRDLVAAGAAVGLVAIAAVIGGALYLSGNPVHASSAPFMARWLPHVGPGTPFALAIAAAVAWRGPHLAASLSWRRLLAAGYATAILWILSLAMVDGWQRGLAGRLTTPYEYLSEVGGVVDVSDMLNGFAGRILDFQPDSWATHVSGHPPGALLVFVGLDRIGLGGGAWAALACVSVGALIAVAVPVTVRALGDEAAGRACMPFVALFPGAVWIGASADGLFAGVTAVGLAMLAVGLTRGRPVVCLLAGCVLAAGLYLSYGLVLLAPLVLAVVLAARAHVRWWTVLPWVAAGGLVPVAAFTIGGFWWVDGYHLVVQRYYQGLASDRPYAYWVWANLASLVGCAGPTVAVVLRRAALTARLWPAIPVAALLPLAGALAIVAADLSGLSKAETERIWLPFAVWFAAGAALLPLRTHRFWLIVQASTALLINHLLLSVW